MSLLQQASLVMTPNAIKESKVYSIIPSSGNGDFTFVRATGATLTNDLGLIETVPYNLFTYSNDFSNSNWSKVYMTVATSSVASPFGNTNATLLTANNQYSSLQQNSTVGIGTYTTSYYVKHINQQFITIVQQGTPQAVVTFDLINGTVYTSNGGLYVGSSITSVGNGWYRISLTINVTTAPFTVASSLWFGFYGPINYDGSQVYAFGAQLVQGSLPKDYFFTTNRLNVPRLNYDFAGSCPSLLLEPQKANLVLYSNDFNQTSWNRASCTITSNFAISPDGSQNAAKLTANGTDPYLEQFTYNPGLSNYYTLSVYAKGVGSTIGKNCIFVLAKDDYAQNVSSAFTLTSEWKRFTASLQFATVPSINAIFRVDLPDTAVAGDEVLVYGFQAEYSVFATSYFPTTTSKLTRNADRLTRGDIFTNGLITNAGGTWFIDQSSNEFTGPGGLEYSIFLTALGQNSLVIGINQNNTLNFYKYTTGSNNINYSIPSSNVARTKVIVRWNASTGGITIFFNGSLITTFASQTFVNYETLALTDANAGNTQNGHKLYSSMLFPTPLTDAECIALTSSNNYTSYSIMALNLNYVIQ